MSCKTRANSKQQILSLIKLNPKDRQLIKVVTVVVPVLRDEVKKTYSPMQKCQSADLYPPNTHTRVFIRGFKSTGLHASFEVTLCL